MGGGGGGLYEIKLRKLRTSLSCFKYTPLHVVFAQPRRGTQIFRAPKMGRKTLGKSSISIRRTCDLELSSTLFLTLLSLSIKVFDFEFCQAFFFAVFF